MDLELPSTTMEAGESGIEWLNTREAAGWLDLQFERSINSSTTAGFPPTDRGLTSCCAAPTWTPTEAAAPSGGPVGSSP